MKLNRKKQRLLFGFLDLFYSSAKNNLDTVKKISAETKEDGTDSEFIRFLEELHTDAQATDSFSEGCSCEINKGYEFTAKIDTFTKKFRLTEKEAAVIASLFLYKDAEASAKSLNIKTGTFNNHLYSIYNKIGVDSKNHLFYLIFSQQARLMR